MTMRVKILLAVIILSFFITGCAIDNNSMIYSSPIDLYVRSQQKLQNRDYRGAIKSLEALNNRYRFNSYSKEAQLDMIYAYYKVADLPLAMETIDRFIRFYPTHAHIDYVLYMRGLIAQALDDNAPQEFFNIDRSERNPQHSIVAFKDFSHLIHFYPNSIYITDAKKRLALLKNFLATHELDIIKYYNKRCAYVAVINRTEQMLKNYPDTQATRYALKYMEMAYNKLGLTQ